SRVPCFPVTPRLIWVLRSARDHFRYCGSLISSMHSTTLPLTLSWIAMCVFHVVALAPCQCFSFGANHTTSPVRFASTGLHSRSSCLCSFFLCSFFQTLLVPPLAPATDRTICGPYFSPQAEQLRTKQGLNRPPIIHRAIPFRYLIQWQRQIEHFSRIDLLVQD